MEYLSCPEKETCVTPCHYIMETEVCTDRRILIYLSRARATKNEEIQLTLFKQAVLSVQTDTNAPSRNSRVHFGHADYENSTFLFCAERDNAHH